MFGFILKTFVKDFENTEDSSVRRRYGILSGVLGIICNFILFAVKICVGIAINSVAVISDAFNNLSDMTSTVISILGIRLSGKKPDRNHPYGHGRFEYISALIVSFIIMLVGVELLKSSVNSVINPSESSCLSMVALILLALSLPVKFFLYGCNKFLGRKINSAVLKATATDSLNDCIATTAVIISSVIDGLKLFSFKIDGYVGAFVSFLIIKAGFEVARDTVNTLLGQTPDEQLINAIKQTVLEVDEIVDVHDFIAHDYGPGRVFATIHAEVSSDSNIVSAHEAIDSVEKAVYDKYGCLLTVHLDPVETDNMEISEIKERIIHSFYESNVSWRFHDVRMTRGEKNMNVIFDVVVPYEVEDSEVDAVMNKLKKDISSLNDIYNCVIQIDRDFENHNQKGKI